jgi:hypothetical protein
MSEEDTFIKGKEEPMILLKIELTYEIPENTSVKSLYRSVNAIKMRPINWKALDESVKETLPLAHNGRVKVFTEFPGP